MLKVKLVSDFPMDSGVRHKYKCLIQDQSTTFTVNGLYRPTEEIIYIIKDISFYQKIVTFTYEIGHWFIDKIISRHRVHYWYDYIWYFFDSKSLQYYRELSKAKKRLLQQQPIYRPKRRPIRW